MRSVEFPTRYVRHMNFPGMVTEMRAAVDFDGRTYVLHEDLSFESKTHGLAIICVSANSRFGSISMAEPSNISRPDHLSSRA